MRVRQGPVEKIEKFTQSKKIPRKIMWLQIPPTFSSAPSKRIGRKIMAPDLKKIPAKNYMAPDPANFLHQLPQKESGEKLYGSRSRQLSSSATSKRIQRKIIWLQFPPKFRKLKESKLHENFTVAVGWFEKL